MSNQKITQIDNERKPAPEAPEHGESKTGPVNRIGTESAQTGDSEASNLPPDPFSPENIRVSQDFGAGLHIKEKLLKVPLRAMPAKEWWVRVHPDEGYTITAPLLELKEDRELFLVRADMVGLVLTDPLFREKLLVTAVTRDADVFLWHLRVPGPDGRRDDWMDTALDACQEARERWVRVYAKSGHYKCQVTDADFGEPAWPDATFRDLLHLAFKDRLVDSPDHPVLKRLGITR